MASTTDMEKQPLLDADHAVATDGPEPTLAELQSNIFTAQRAYMKAWSRTTSGKWHRRIMFSVTAFLLLVAAACMAFIVTDSLDDDRPFPGRVPLEAHIMSRCPDARDCLHDMILPAMQEISHKVDFKLSYIGNSTTDDGVSCRHGQSECLGDIVELCAANLYPDPQVYLGFVMCMTRDYEDIPDRSLVEDCALEHGISMARLNKCAIDDDGAVGMDMLKASFNRSSNAGVEKSCTVRLNGHVRCVRDNGTWTDCEGGSTATDLVHDVMEQSRLNWEAYANAA
ncbi:hypothetical protein LTR91_000479 [Friedmanniomyces endolithicus]|uniref:Gamma interferon inducible lysosomal thiol reductase GILT n=1 Tax=Friedmanniomyces endolithicus TaxID=329885 RepID=A0AAN6FM23_9PEZI|nr:hypothetical protein LTS00_014564 [Friedmanniomyces endolithicus]KAK0277562.1 hypothetical protein LTR35_009964 [Friedmanniomyces endolithicus]KAK0319947.1 hypothetical protein LTR82_008882 [Friedmanniomyces endolithicus]KAK0913276.1 hypothetical protein LTR57_014485 [Friedmanniomyces endolithicus]KAK0975113.1 hypothetical protein LTS01_013926 [Friedmanniomyces endolithicus]